MRNLLLFALILVLPVRAAAACEGGEYKIIFQPGTAAFLGEINGVPLAYSDGSDDGLTDAYQLTPWLLTGKNDVTITVVAPGAAGVFEVYKQCPTDFVTLPGDSPNSLGIVKLDKVGTQSIGFEAEQTLDLPYLDAQHQGDDGLADAVKALQAAYREKDVAKVVEGYDGMLQVSAILGEPITKSRLTKVMEKTLPTAEVAYVENFSIRNALDGRIRVVTGPNGYDAPIALKGKGLRLTAGRIWSHIDGKWLMVAQ